MQERWVPVAQNRKKISNFFIGATLLFLKNGLNQLKSQIPFKKHLLATFLKILFTYVLKGNSISSSIKSNIESAVGFLIRNL